MTEPLVAVLRLALSWPVASQERSRRNAMVASTAMAQQRLERLDTEAFLRQHVGRRGPSGRHAVPRPQPRPAFPAPNDVTPRAEGAGS